MTEPAIACTLDAPEAADRQRLIAALWAEALLRTEPTATGIRAHLRNGPGIEPRVRRLIEAEARCCPFLTLQLTANGDRLLLDVSGPREARPIIADFFSGSAS